MKGFLSVMVFAVFSGPWATCTPFPNNQHHTWSLPLSSSLKKLKQNKTTKPLLRSVYAAGRQILSVSNQSLTILNLISHRVMDTQLCHASAKAFIDDTEQVSFNAHKENCIYDH